MYAYHTYQLPPVDVEPSERLVIAIAPIQQCRHHGPGNPVCPESNYVPWIYENWTPFVSEIWCRGYMYNLGCPALPISIVHRLSKEIPMWYDLGVIGYHPDYASTFATYNPGPFIRNRLAWDHTADVNELLAEFYENFYGPASGPMKSYHTLIDERHGTSDYHTGFSWDMPNFFPPELREGLRKHLDEARKLVAEYGNGHDAVRLEITRKGFEYLDAYCDVLLARG